MPIENFELNRLNLRVEELKTNIVQLDTKIGGYKIRIDDYHKEKNNCLKTCEGYMEKTNELLINNAVQDTKIKTFSDTIPELWKAIEIFRNIERRVYMITGGIAVLAIIAQAIFIPLFLRKMF
jgi:hypothetical protein